MRKFILLGAFCLSMWVSFPTLASQPNDRDWTRIERQVDKLTEGAGTSAIELERRLSGIEANQREIKVNQSVFDSKIDSLIKLGLGIMASVIGLIIQAFWGLIVGKRPGEGK